MNAISSIPSTLAGIVRSAACLALVAAAVHGQGVDYTFNGTAAGDGLGYSVAGAGDVNQDGFPDLIVGAPVPFAKRCHSPGTAIVYSGKDGTQLWKFDGKAANDAMGRSVAGAGDVNRDGYPDLIVGANGADPCGRTDAGSAYVFSGKDGSLLWKFDGAAERDRLGWSVAGAGDVNRDGVPDLIVGAWGADSGQCGAGAVYVFSGRDGTELWQFDGAAVGDKLGWSVAGAGDVNQDGFDDVIAGAFSADPHGRYAAGSAYVFSGSDGAVLWQFDGAAVKDRLGWSVAGAGDVNQDGFADLIVGAWGADPGESMAGSAYLYSGKDGTTLREFNGETARDGLGYSVAGAGDVNRDGVPDLIVGAYFADPDGVHAAGSAYVYSGVDGTVLRHIKGATCCDHLGRSVAGAGDVNQDGGADVIVGAPCTDPGGTDGAGSAFVYSIGPS